MVSEGDCLLNSLCTFTNVCNRSHTKVYIQCHVACFCQFCDFDPEDDLRVYRGDFEGHILR